MALVLQRLYNGYFWLMDELSDPRPNNYFLMSSPFPVIVILTLYFYFIYNWGPKYMEQRPAYDLKKIIIVYNISQIIVNFYLTYQGLFILKDISWECSEIDYTENGRSLLDLAYIYFLTKLGDLLDTVFFVLKKKNQHVSFLHVYHHFGMVCLTWIGCKFLGGGHSFYLGWINAIVHCLMYTYYLMTALDDSFKKNIGFKKFITQIQIAQFAFLLYVYAKLLFQPDCGYPKIASYFFLPQNLFMTMLFTDFYIRSYILKSNTTPKTPETSKDL